MLERLGRPVRLSVERVGRHRPSPVDGAAPDAAVCVPVLERGGDHHLLFTRRAEGLARHPGEMSFPGGSREPDDDSLVATALREAGEEVGLEPTAVRMLGRLDDVPGLGDTVVRPVVVQIPDRAYAPTSAEVAAVVVLPVVAFVRPGAHESERRVHPDRGSVRVHVFRVDGHVVWGVTGAIVASLLAVATDWSPPDAVDRTVAFDADPPE